MFLSQNLVLLEVMRSTTVNIQRPDILRYLAALLNSTSPLSHHLYVLLIGHSLLLRQLESHSTSPLIDGDAICAGECIHDVTADSN